MVTAATTDFASESVLARAIRNIGNPMGHKARFATVSLTAVCALFAHVPHALADSFVITNGQDVTSLQELDGDNETGIIEDGGSVTSGVDVRPAVSVSGANGTIENSGVVRATGEDSRAIRVFGANATITNTSTGSISTAGANGYAIQASGDGLVVRNYGSISTTGASANGIYSEGAEARITNSGDITTSGGGAHAINSSGDDATIDTSGSIRTEGAQAYGIRSEGANARITNSGSIITSSYGADGIRSGDINVVIENSGHIGTTGDEAHGINALNTNATITNLGTISVTGNQSFGISSQSDGASIRNSGRIDTDGSNTIGIKSLGDDVSIENSGQIHTIGYGNHAIRTQGENQLVANSGSIVTEGSLAYGIVTTNSHAGIRILNSGEITTLDSGAHGIFSQPDNIAVNIDNSGRIQTSDGGSRGIDSRGVDARISNSGHVTTSGNSSHGINASGDGTTIDTSGSIHTAGSYAYGIRSEGAAARITNSGNIGTSGDNADGIRSGNTDVVIDNSGHISTTGDESHAINVLNTNAMIRNGGSVRTSGDEAHAVFLDGNDATLDNGGLISASGSGSFAILGGFGTQTVNVLAGSRIAGAIDLGDGVDTANIHGSDGSAVLTFANTENINLHIDNAVRVGDSVVVVDPTGESVLGHTLAALTSGAHHSISQRAGRTPAFKPVQVAATELAPGALHQEQGPSVWGQVFGYSGERGAEAQVQAYDHDYHGFIAGHEQSFSDTRVGFVGGLARSKTDSDSFKRDSDSLFIGVYGHFDLGAVQLTASLLAGREEHDGKRAVLDNIEGMETARSNTDSYFISPSLTVGSAFVVRPGFELRPSATLSYTAARYDAYAERGTTNANLSVRSRSLQTLASRLQLEAALQIEGGELTARMGAHSRHSDADDVKASLAGSNFRYGAASDRRVSGGFIGAGADLDLNEQFKLTFDIEHGRMSGDEDYVSAQVSLKYSF